MSQPRALIIGLGSIGRRHQALLTDLGCAVAACTRHAQPELPCFEDLDRALREHRPQFIVVANPTSDHEATLKRLAELAPEARLMVEKPLSSHVPDGLPASLVGRIAVGYNLRFHPAVLALRAALRDEEPVSAQLYAGQHLPDWRPGRDYRTSYSASAAQGGGVLRDLSHELDLALWLFGPWQRLVAHGGHFSGLDIETEDTVGLLWQAERCPKVGVEINYLDRAPRRSILVHTRRHTWEADVFGARLLRDGELLESWMPERNATYRDQDRAWLQNETGILCTFDEGLAVLHMIAAAEVSLQQAAWIRSSPSS